RDVVAEAAGQHELGHAFAADPGHLLEQRNAGGDRPLRELDLADVLLGEDDLARRTGFSGAQQHDLARVADLPDAVAERGRQRGAPVEDRKSTRLNSSHVAISYAVFCLKKKNK